MRTRGAKTARQPELSHWALRCAAGRFAPTALFTLAQRPRRNFRCIKKIALPYRHALPSAICRTTRASGRPAQRASIPIDARSPPPAVQLNQGFFEVATLRSSVCAQAALATSKKPPDSLPLGRAVVIGTERTAQHLSAAHQKEGPDRASKTRTGDEQPASPCRRSDVLAMREKS